MTGKGDPRKRLAVFKSIAVPKEKPMSRDGRSISVFLELLLIENYVFPIIN